MKGSYVSKCLVSTVIVLLGVCFIFVKDCKQIFARVLHKKTSQVGKISFHRNTSSMGFYK